MSNTTPPPDAATPAGTDALKMCDDWRVVADLIDTPSGLQSVRPAWIVRALRAAAAQVAALSAEVARLKGFMERQGYRRCDIPACNCNEWHGGHASDRLREISDLLADAGVPGGTTIYGGVVTIRERAEAAESALLQRAQEHERLREMVRNVPPPILIAHDMSGARCEWCRAEWNNEGDFGRLMEPSSHPDNGCLYVVAQKGQG